MNLHQFIRTRSLRDLNRLQRLLAREIERRGRATAFGHTSPTGMSGHLDNMNESTRRLERLPPSPIVGAQYYLDGKQKAFIRDTQGVQPADIMLCTASHEGGVSLISGTGSRRLSVELTSRDMTNLALLEEDKDDAKVQRFIKKARKAEKTKALADLVASL